jgi:hypothetical protein
MSDLLLRHVDERLIRRLKAKAEINGTSLQQEAKKAIARGAPLTPEEKATDYEQLRRQLGGHPKLRTSGAEIVREMREEGP